MELREFLSGIRFRHILPESSQPVVTLPYPYVNQYPQNILMEMDNAILPAEEQPLRDRVLSVWHVPRLSSFLNGAIVNYAVSRMKTGLAYVHAGNYNSYLLHPFHLLAGMSGQPGRVCIGVDDFTRFGHSPDPFLLYFNSVKSDHHRFYDMDPKDYFSRVHDVPIGCYMFDGLPDYDGQMEGLKQAEPFFAEGCTILAADTNWPEKRQAVLDFVRRQPWNYEILLDVQTNGNCHPTYWNGLMVVQKTI
ncbi:hypothetical protein [Cohnella candidum]|uniref:Class I SAM-dependent methyltransferase n=1 Tax=Cohnella candidum TaxID=2674991 RepID=A0A3G3JT93_9BACL|nr:hypothetical protein [Cohnella candidum]AYQ71445.1 hypothetical protein EAV92_01895 [Cohnella candidum]